MSPDSLILDLSPWAAPLGTIFTQALSPATPPTLHRALAEQATATLEQAAAMAALAPDEAAPWRAMRTEEALFLATEDGFAFGQFEGPDLVSLRVETEDGRRWTAIFTGRGLGALGLLEGSGGDPDLKVALFADERLLWSRSFYGDGHEADDLDLAGAQAEARDRLDLTEEGAEAADGAGAGLAWGGGVGAAILGAGALLLRRSLERRAAPAQEAPPPPAPAPVPQTPSAWHLRCTAGPMKGASFLLQAPAVLGRDPTVDIPVEDLSVSRRHAKLHPTPEGFLLEDLGSSNGTWIGEARVAAPVLLRDGDTFTLGVCAFQLARDREGPAPETPPATCPRCRIPLEPGWKFCGGCGTALTGLDSRRLCAQCGAALSEGMRFCAECGRPT